jgi:hypothetical protein
VLHIAEDEQMFFLWQDIPTSDWNDVHQERWHHTVFLFCKMQEERSHLQERPAQAEMDNVLREEGTWLSNPLMAIQPNVCSISLLTSLS